LAGISAGPVGYGVVLWGIGFYDRVEGIFRDEKMVGNGSDYATSEENMLEWFQVSFLIFFFTFAFATLVILGDLLYLGVHKLIGKNRQQVVNYPKAKV